MELESQPSPPPSRRLWLAGAGVGVLGVGAGLWGWRQWSGAADGAAANELPEIWGMQFMGLGGRTLTMSEFRGKPLLLNFWATWCPPCLAEMPALGRFYGEYAAKGWQVIGLAVDRVEPVSAFVKKLGIGFPVGVVGTEGIDLSFSMGNSSSSLPFTAVFGSNGRLSQRKIGQVSESELAAWGAATH